MPAAKKLEAVSELNALLSEGGNFVITTYSGLNVEQFMDLRRKAREKDSRVKVVKNNLFRLALKSSPVHEAIAGEFDGDLKGPVAVTFSGEDFSAASKVLLDYGKEIDRVKIKSGCMDGQYLREEDVKQIANLPSREELLGVVARGLNAPATKIASGMNEIISKLARAVKAVGEKNG